MKTAIAGALLLLSLFACGTDEGGSGEVATDPAPTTATSEPASAAAEPTGSPMPTEVPAAPGVVRTTDLSTVIDDGLVELCLGPVAKSFPPQCGGVPVLGWDWAERKGAYETQQETRWGRFMVTGTFDGSALTVQSAIPAALYDGVPAPVDPLPEAASTYPSDGLGTVADAVAALPGASGVDVEGQQVLVTVTYDDGSLQAWADGEFGKDVVVVLPQLVDVS